MSSSSNNNSNSHKTNSNKTRIKARTNKSKINSRRRIISDNRISKTRNRIPRISRISRTQRSAINSRNSPRHHRVPAANRDRLVKKRKISGVPGNRQRRVRAKSQVVGQVRENRERMKS